MYPNTVCSTLRRRRQPWCPRWWGRRRRSRRSRGPPVGTRDGAGGQRRTTTTHAPGKKMFGGRRERFVGFHRRAASTPSTRARGSGTARDVRTVASSSSLRLREICTRILRGTCGRGSGSTGPRSASVLSVRGNSPDRVPNPRTWRCEKCGAEARLLTLRMPLDQIALLSFTSTRTSEVFMTFCANFFTCWRRGGGVGERGCSGKKDSSPREREAGEPGPRWADGNDPSPGDARHRSTRTASQCPIHDVNDRTPRRSGESTVVTRVDAASRASHRRLALIAARLSRGWALTACTARGALFLKVSPWTALARLMVYSRVTTS